MISNEIFQAIQVLFSSKRQAWRGTSARSGSVCGRGLQLRELSGEGPRQNSKGQVPFQILSSAEFLTLPAGLSGCVQALKSRHVIDVSQFFSYLFISVHIFSCISFHRFSSLFALRTVCGIPSSQAPRHDKLKSTQCQSDLSSLPVPSFCWLRAERFGLLPSSREPRSSAVV